MPNEVVIVVSTAGARQAQGELNSVTGSLKRLGEVAGGMVVGDFATNLVGGIRDAIGATIDFSNQLQQGRIAFDTMTRSAEVGGKLLADLKTFTLGTPFEFPDALEGAKRLMAMGTAAEDLIPTMAMLGDISAGVGREKLPQLILALGQVGAATKLRGTELRQFTEAGVPLLALLGEQLGKSAGTIQKMAEEGQISFKQVRDALASTTQEGGIFFGLMEKQSKTFGGAMSNVRDALRFASEEGFRPLFSQLTAGANLLANFIQSAPAKQFAADVSNAMALVVGAIGGVLTVGANLFQLVAANEPLVKGLAITVGAVLAPSLLAAAGGLIAIIAPAVGVATVLGTVAAAVAVVIDHWSLFEQAGNIVRTVIGNIAETIGSVLRPAFEAMGQIIGRAAEFIADRVKTLAQLAVIAGNAAGQSMEDMQGLIAFANGIGGKLDLSDIKTTFDGVGEGVGNAISGMVENAKAGLGSLQVLIDATMARLAKPIEIPIGEVGLGPKREFTGTLPPVAGELADTAKTVKDVLAAMLPVMEQLKQSNAFKVWREEMKKFLAEGQLEFVIKQFEALGKNANETAREILSMFAEIEQGSAKAAEELAETLKAALAGGKGKFTVELVQKGLEDFAKAEWIKTLDAQIQVVAGQIHNALAAGLDPSEIIARSKVLFETYAEAAGQAAEAMGEAIRQALSQETGGDVLAQVRQGLESFAKAELIKTLEEEIRKVATQIQAALKAGLDPSEIVAGATELFRAYQDALKDTAAAAARMAEAIQAALSGLSGDPLALVKQGLEAFAKAEWIKTLEEEIRKVAGEIQAALKAGLDPSDIITGAKSLFEAYTAAIRDTANAITAEANRIKQAAEDMLNEISLKNKAFMDEQKAGTVFTTQRKEAWERATFGITLREMAERDREAINMANARRASLQQQRAELARLSSIIGDLASQARQRFEDLRVLAQFQGVPFNPYLASQEAFAFAQRPYDLTGLNPRMQEDIQIQRARFFTGLNLPPIIFEVDGQEFGRIAGQSSIQQGLNLLRMGVG